MPLYEFYCPECQKKFEKLCRSLVDKYDCPACGEPSRRVLSLFRRGKGNSMDFGSMGSGSGSGCSTCSSSSCSTCH